MRPFHNIIIKNLVSNLKIIRAAKTHHWHNVYSECKYDMKQTWKNINSILSKTPNKNNLPNSFLHEGHNITDAEHISNVFNKFEGFAYVDDVHYSPKANKIIAEKIKELL